MSQASAQRVQCPASPAPSEPFRNPPCALLEPERFAPPPNARREPRFDPDIWIAVVEAALEAKAAGTPAIELIEADGMVWSTSKNKKPSMLGSDGKPTVAEDAPAPPAEDTVHKEKGMAEDLKAMSPEERKQAIKDRVKARRAEKLKEKEL